MSDKAPSLDNHSTTSLMVLMFSDIVDSVALKTKLGGPAYRRLVDRHDRIYRDVVDSTRGAACLKDTGDGFLSRFVTASDAVTAALRFEHALSTGDWDPQPLKVRIGIHVGEVEELANDISGIPKIVGLAADIAARVMSLAQGGQILLTRTAFDSARQYVREHPPVEDGQTAPQIQWCGHGAYLFAGSDESIEIFEVGAVGIAPLSAPPDTVKGHRARGNTPSFESAGKASGSGGSRNAVLALILALLIGVGGMGYWWKYVRQEPTEPGKKLVTDKTTSGKKTKTTGGTDGNSAKQTPDKAKQPVNPIDVPPNTSTSNPPDKINGSQNPIPGKTVPTGIDLLDAINPNAPFTLKLQTGEVKTRYRDGEFITFEIQADRDCYITMLTVDSRGDLTLLMPNKWQQQTFVKSGQTLRVPAKESGFRFPIKPPHGITLVKAIGTLQPLKINKVDKVRLVKESFVFLGNTQESIDPLTPQDIGKMLDSNEWASVQLTIITTPDPKPEDSPAEKSKDESPAEPAKQD